MELEHTHRLLARMGVVRRPCDLDLVIFFAKHPTTLLASEQLAVLLGYDFKQLAASLDQLVEAGVVTRTTNPRFGVHMYVFAAGHSSDGWLPDLLQVAGTRDGRLAMLQALGRGEPDSQAPPDQATGNAARRRGSNKRRKVK